MSRINRNQRRKVVHARVRRRLEGSARRPRLAVYRTLNHIYVQAIDDAAGVTLAQASSLDAGGEGKGKRAARKPGAGGSVAAAKAVGTLIAERLKALGCDDAVFDRGGYLYHGRVKALADAAREAGLRF
jgi:large subunit ribosomal protein L18